MKLETTYKRILVKKCVLISICLTLMALLVACGGSKTDTMSIRPSKFSEETQDVLKIIGDEIAFFDYEVDDTIKSMRTDIWVYEDGEWVSVGGTRGNIETKENRIAVRMNNSNYDIFNIDESGYVKSSYKSIVDFSQSNTSAQSRLNEPIIIEANQEITLWTKLGSDKGQIPVNMNQDFRDLECTVGVAVTITFSDKVDVTGEEEKLTLDIVAELAKKGESLSWSDFEKYSSTDIGSGLYILRYDIDEEYYLIVGGSDMQEPPMYIRLANATDKEDYIDIRTDDVKKFINHS